MGFNGSINSRQTRDEDEDDMAICIKSEDKMLNSDDNILIQDSTDKKRHKKSVADDDEIFINIRSDD